MGREIRRVPVGFDHPLRKTWPGFVNPHSPRHCPDCQNGYSKAAERYYAEWHGDVPFDPRSTGSTPFGADHPAIRERARRNILNAPDYYGTGEAAIRREAVRLAIECFDNRWAHHLSQADVDALVAADRLREFTHAWTRQDGWQPKIPPVHPTAAEVNLWSLGSFLSGDNYVCIKARCERNGERLTCPTCNGSGTDPADAATIALSEAWESTDPPAGDAYQIWETVSEGSPITPAFADPRTLAAWCAAHQFDGGKSLSAGEPWNGLAGGTAALTAEQWLKFIAGPGWAPSGVFSPERGYQSGVAAAVEE